MSIDSYKCRSYNCRSKKKEVLLMALTSHRTGLTSNTHLSNAGHLGWQQMHSFTKWHLWRLIKYHSFDALWSLGRKSVFCTFLRVLYRVHNARSTFYTRVHILYPVRNALVRVLYLSACFVLFSTFPAMQYQIGFFHTFSHLRNLKKCVQRRVTIPQGQQHDSSFQQS